MTNQDLQGKSMRGRIIKRNLFLLLLGVCFFGGYKANQMLPIATGFAAKNMCSCVFNAHRNQQQIQSDDLNFSLVKFTNSKVDISRSQVTSSLFGFFKRTAKYDPIIGCTMDYDGDEITGRDVPCKYTKDAFSQHSLETIRLPKADQNDSLWQKFDRSALISAIDGAFDKPTEKTKKNTRTVLVVYNGKIIGEQYAAGFSPDIPQLGWSMTKSFMNAWMGILVGQGSLNLDDYPDIPDWKNDDRKSITYRHLLQMNSGLEWEELYGNATDITRMLYLEPDVANYAMNKPLAYPVGTHWNYASGTTNILSGLLKQKESGLLKQKELNSNYYCFLDEHLFKPLGMESVIIEPDQKGTLICSSYGFATPQDWARFGLLYLNDGVVNGNRILPEGWVAWTREVSTGSEGKYGAHFWLNANGYYPDAPKDMFSANGFQGQRIFILPTHDLVIVRLGNSEGDDFDHNGLVSGIIDSFE